MPGKHYNRVRDDYSVGIDGEGQGRDKHHYVMLAWSNPDGRYKRVLEAAPGERLTTQECFDFILNIPNRASTIFGFSLGYDWTKILMDLDDESIYKLYRPDLRRGPNGRAVPVTWNGYEIDMISRRFTVRKGKRVRVVWDIFAFYQTRFTNALTLWFSKEVPEATSGAVLDMTSKTRWRLWDVAEMDDEIAQMIRMKEQRGEFDLLDRAKILDYCFVECRRMAGLADKLIKASSDAGLDLKAFHGAGSVAKAMMRIMGIKKCVRDVPDHVKHAVACAFSGGRFEDDIQGPVYTTVYGGDISSAYPYQITFLPCLGCGKWELAKSRKDLEDEECKTALVNYTLAPTKEDIPWAPFPFRLRDGSICYPSSSGGGWVWKDEYIQGERLFPNVQFRDAWVYRCSCNHQPFSEVPTYYLVRLRLGKEGPGIIVKLGSNSIYGALAQSVGLKPPYQSWAWAGMTTSGCRAQILQVLGLHKDRRNMLSVATDGYKSLEDITCPLPRDTGTMTDHKKPLGGWERVKPKTKGMFFARPGIHWPLYASDEEIEEVRARGVGRKTLYNATQLIVDGFLRGDDSTKIGKVSKFWGAKSCVTYAPKEGTYTRSPKYGQWEEITLEVNFNPLPKRTHRRYDNSLAVRVIPQDMESMPYPEALPRLAKPTPSVESMLMSAMKDDFWDNPDGDYATYE